MGNCQAAEAATAVVQHPGGKMDRIYWSVSANEIMNSNPGHYVAQVVAIPAVAKGENGAAPVNQVKLLPPDDTLVIGQVYRLISFEDVLKELAAKKCVKLGRLLKERGAFSMEKNKNQAGSEHCSNSQSAATKTASSSRGVGRHHGGGGQWRPALQSISELGT